MKIDEARITLALLSLILGILTKNPIAALLSPLFLVDRYQADVLSGAVIFASTVYFGGIVYFTLMIPAVLLASEKYYYVPLTTWVLFDMASTIYLYSTGSYTELNPLMSIVLHNSVPMFVLLKLLSLSIIVIAVKISPREYRRIVVILVALLSFLPAGLNSLHFIM